MGTFLKIALVAWGISLVVYAGLRLAGYPKEAAVQRLRFVDSIFFYGLLALVIVVTVLFG